MAKRKKKEQIDKREVNEMILRVRLIVLEADLLLTKLKMERELADLELAMLI